MTEEADIEPVLTISNSPCDVENQIHKSKIRGFRWLKTHENYKNILILFSGLLIVDLEYQEAGRYRIVE